MRTGTADEAWPAEAFGLAGGCAAVVVAALATAAVVAPAHVGARMLIMAVTVGVLAAVLTDWRACLGVAVVGALIFVGFLAHRDGVLTGSTAAWPYTIMIGLAAVLGRAVRRMRHA
jgi:cell division protein FtsW (lipid II flippase)